MASDHVIALSHLAGVGLGLALVAFAGRGWARSRHPRVRMEEAKPRRRRLRPLARLLGRCVHSTARLAVNVVLVLASPLGLLCANQRYLLVAPVLAPFEVRVAALGHRSARARCFPLLAWHVWLVRCAGCGRRSFFREVPAPGGAGVELKVLGKDAWHTRRCLAEYLTARPALATGSAYPVRPLRRRVRPARPVPGAPPAAAVAPAAPQPPATDKSA